MENNTNTTGTESTQVQENTPKTFTEEEVNRLIDQRVTQAIQTQQKKAEKKIAEATKLAQMNEAEKYEYQLQQREEAIIAKEKELVLATNRAAADKVLAERGIPLTLVDFVVAEDAETMKANIDALDTAFKEAVKGEIEKRLASKTPRQNMPTDTELTLDQFHKLSITELHALAETNPGLYNKLSQAKYNK